MSDQETIVQIMPATDWVAVYNMDGEESAEPIVCFALVETVENGVKRRDVRPMCANENVIDFADDAENFLRVETLEAFEEGEGEEEEEEEEEAVEE
ncbi:hypothetical protein [Dyella tabacisoli]|uniref:Uncharacterized protein n=1 Tax=Dyella tabacisoli TaxID=2282381 RepID=A0A369ULR3_9GAMM|nr:hypothetical protein [Dyella tabacisoli]RDD81471.1 hypothetical protein DVJ77_09795 [Dyella tabacisoli]